MVKFKELPRSVQLVLSAGAVATAMVAISIPTVWALDTRYVTVASVEQAFLVRDIRNVKREIRKLQFLVDAGTASDLDIYELKGLIEELADMEAEK